MKQTLILLAGYPGTGKSYLAELLMKQFTGFEILSPDEIKEEFWDAYGFRNEQEKEELIQKSWVEYYHRMEWKFTRGISLLSDYPFSYKQHDQLQEVCDKHHVQIITIRMIADLDVLFERQKKRDLKEQMKQKMEQMKTEPQKEPPSKNLENEVKEHEK